MGKFLSAMLLGSTLLAGIAAPPAQAGTPLTLYVDHSLVIPLQADPGMIVLGNPSIADVTLNGRQLILNGRSFGETNLIILDQAGNRISDFELAVTQNNPNQVTVFVGSGKGQPTQTSYVCAPTCERAMVVGDTDLTTVIGANSAKSNLSLGVKPSTAAPAQQGGGYNP